MFERLFKLKKNGTTLRIEIVAGVTTFMTMAYILAVNPSILHTTGMNYGAVFTATALAAVIGTLIMAFLANLPFALAPGMGLNAFFAYTVVSAMGYTWEFALTAVFIEGIIFIILTAFKIREAIVNCIPLCLKHAVSCGIGLFIAFIGLLNAGIVKSGMNITPDGKHLSGLAVTLGDLSQPIVLVAIVGLLVGGVLLIKKVKGALLIAIIIGTIVAIPLGVTQLPADGHFLSLPPSLKPILFKFQMAHIFSLNMVIVVFTFLFVDLFDTVGTLVGVASKANMLDKDGQIPKLKEALFADAIGTTCGAVLGTSTVTTYVESAAGVAEGGRTGMTAFTVAILFFLALFFAPIFVMIPAAATAPALILVGLFMMGPIVNIDLNNYIEAIPCFLAIILMPLSYSISEGIAFGIVSFVALHLLSGKVRKLNVVMVCLAILFIFKYTML